MIRLTVCLSSTPPRRKRPRKAAKKPGKQDSDPQKLTPAPAVFAFPAHDITFCRRGVGEEANRRSMREKKWGGEREREGGREILCLFVFLCFVFLLFFFFFLWFFFFFLENLLG